MKIFEVIPIDIYDHDVVLSVNQSDEELLADMGDVSIKKFDRHLRGQKNLGRTVRFKGGGIVMRFITEDMNCNLISHEAYHATHYLLRRVGIPYCLETEEAYAYLLGYIVGKINKIIENDTRK